jgi:hypothetical protein
MLDFRVMSTCFVSADARLQWLFLIAALHAHAAGSISTEKHVGLHAFPTFIHLNQTAAIERSSTIRVPVIALQLPQPLFLSVQQVL